MASGRLDTRVVKEQPFACAFIISTAQIHGRNSLRTKYFLLIYQFRDKPIGVGGYFQIVMAFWAERLCGSSTPQFLSEIRDDEVAFGVPFG